MKAIMDEMGKSIRMKSESLGFKFVIVVLAAWTIVELVLYLAFEHAYNYMPSLLLIATLLVQGFYEQSMKRRMVAGDDEYQEPSFKAQAIVTAAGVMLVTFIVGFVALYIG